MGIFYISKDNYSCVLLLCAYILIKEILLAWRSPCIYIKIFTTNKPIHSTLFRSCWYEHKSLAGAIFTCSVELLPKIRIIMTSHFVTTKAFRVASEPRALGFFSLIPVSYLKIMFKIHKFHFLVIPLHGHTNYLSFF